MKRLGIVVIIIIAILALSVLGAVGLQKIAGDKVAAAVIKTTAPKEVDGPLVSIGEFTVNLIGNAYLKTSITLEGVDAKSEEVLKTKQPFLKDKVNSVLANKSLADVQTGEAREKLRQELLAKLNELTDKKIKSVLFESFMYQ